jgi:hypothetical protein
MLNGWMEVYVYWGVLKRRFFNSGLWGCSTTLSG